jgi:hypothetical protein
MEVFFTFFVKFLTLKFSSITFTRGYFPCSDGDIRICIDFYNLNKSAEKYNYLVPPIEQILQKVVRVEMFSLLDDFLGYHQVSVSQPYHIKTTFRIKWGNYASQKMPFSLISVRATFQRDMEIGLC